MEDGDKVDMWEESEMVIIEPHSSPLHDPSRGYNVPSVVFKDLMVYQGRVAIVKVIRNSIGIEEKSTVSIHSKGWRIIVVPENKSRDEDDENNE